MSEHIACKSCLESEVARALRARAGHVGTPPSVRPRSESTGHPQTMTISLDRSLWNEDGKGVSRISPVRKAVRWSKLSVIAASLVFLLAPCPPASAQTIPPDTVSASLQLSRDTVYEHECFDMVLAIEIRDAQVGRGMELAGMPDTKLLQIGQFKELPLQRIARAGRQVEIRSYRSEVRALSTGSVPISLSLRVSIVRTQNTALGTMRFESPVSVNVNQQTIRIVPLPPQPAQGVFSGAVGRFQFSATATPANLAPGELVRIQSRIVGKGWTDGVLPPRVSPGGAFRVYEPKAVPVPLGETPEIQFEQTLVPQTTNATDIPVLTFTYFDPASRSYHSATAGPFRLHFQPRRAIDIDDPVGPMIRPPAAAPERIKSRSLLEGVHPSIRWKALTVAIVYWFVVAVTMGVIATRLRRGVIAALALLVAALLIFAGGAATARQRFLVRPMSVTTRQEDARVSPGPDALITFTIPKDSPVMRIDELGDWAKIESAGNRGWVPASALSAKR